MKESWEDIASKILNAPPVKMKTSIISAFQASYIEGIKEQIRGDNPYELAEAIIRKSESKKVPLKDLIALAIHQYHRRGK